MDVDRIAGELLKQHLQGQRFGLLPEIATLPSAYDVQDALIRLLAAEGGGAVAGYKIGLTTTRMQAMCGIGEPIAGVVLSTRLHRSPARVAARAHGRLGVESELAFRIDRTPLPGASATELWSCVGAVAAAFELIDDRQADYAALDARSLVANNSWNAGIVLGPETRPPTLGPMTGSLSRNGDFLDKGLSSDVLGDPLNAIAWMDAHLRTRGQVLLPGQWIMTGSIVTTKFAEPGDFFHFELGELPAVELHID